MMGSSESKEPDRNATQNDDCRTQKTGGKARKSFPVPKQSLKQVVDTDEAERQQEPSTHRNENSKNNYSQKVSSTTATRRRLRRISSSEEEDADVGITNNVDSNLTPILIPKRERVESITEPPRDPRMRTDNPTEVAIHDPIPSVSTVKREKESETALSSVIEIVENVKIEDAPESDNWMGKFLNRETTSLDEPIRIKTEPVDKDDDNATQPTEDHDDRCSVDSGSTVGLPSPPSSPLPTSTNDNEPSSHSNETSLAFALPGISSNSTNGMQNVNSDSDSILANKASSCYSAPTDLQEEYRKYEQEKLASDKAKKLQAYSHDSSDTSSDEELPKVAEDTNNRFSDGDDDQVMFGDDDGVFFGDDDHEIDSSWVSPEPLAEEEAVQQKRLLAIEEAPDKNEVQPPAKKSKFQVYKNPQFFADTSVASVSVPDEAVASTSTAIGLDNNVESSASQTTFETAQPTTVVDKDQPSTRSKIPVKLTTHNRASMMVEDFLNSVNTTAVQVQKKRPATPTKIKPKLKKLPTKEKAIPSYALNSAHDTSDVEIPSAAYEDVSHHQQNPSRTLAHIRDPRLRSSMGIQLNNHAEKIPPICQPLEKMLKLRNEVKTSILTRVLKWQFKWIEQQSIMETPPPLLAKVKIDNNVELPEINCNFVISEYPDRKTYFAIFHPLLMHEMWSKLCIENQREIKEGKNFDWDVLINSSTNEGNFFLLNCSLIMSSEAEAPMLNDLIVLSHSRPTGESINPFAFVESSKITKVVGTSDIDRRLLMSKVNPVFSAEVLIRILKNYAPKETNIKCSMSKVASLSTAMALFEAEGALAISPITKVIFKPQPSAFKLMSSRSLTNNNLDPVQSNAAYSIGQTMLLAQSSESLVAMLQGYPGTGKTHVLVYTIGHIMGHKKDNIRHKILYCAPTNAAVDEMIRRLLSYNKGSCPDDPFNVLRIGKWSKLLSDVKNFTLEEKLERFVFNERIKQKKHPCDHLVECKKKLLSYKKQKKECESELFSIEIVPTPERSRALEIELDGIKDDIKAIEECIKDVERRQMEKIEDDLQTYKRDLITNADVICTTLEACYNTDMENIFIKRIPDRWGQIPRPFLCCIIDDASLCTEPQTLFPLALGMNKLILVGDSELTPFTLHSSVAKEHKLDQSLFSRFHSYLTVECYNDENLLMHTLNTQHRMDEEVCKWANKYYYGNKLLTSGNLKSSSPLHPYRVLDVKDSLEIPDGTSFINKAEAEVVVNIIEGLCRSHEIMGKVIGVITFFEKHRLYIRHVLEKRFPSDSENRKIEVKLVQDLQGTEMDIVIISCAKTRIDRKGKNLTVLTDHWNLAITRATESLYICGNLKALQANEILKDLICDADKRQAICRVSSLFEMSLLYDVLLKPN